MDVDWNWIRFGFYVLAIAVLLWLTTYDDRNGGHTHD